MIHTLYVTRRELLDVLSDERPQKLFRSKRSNLNDIRPPVEREEVCLIWEHDPNEGVRMPGAIAVADNSMMDFLAWASTYLKGFTPFTAYFHVTTFGTLVAAFDEAHTPQFHGLETSCIGAIIGEALSSHTSKTVESLQWRTLTTTLSFCLCRALGNNCSTQSFNAIMSHWMHVASICEVPTAQLDNRNFLTFWRILLALRDQKSLSQEQPIGDHLLLTACRDIHKMGELSGSVLSLMTEKQSEFLEAHLNMKGSWEERVTIFNRMLNGNMFANIPETWREFLCGYFANQIAPGSLRHSVLLTGVAQSMPMASFWYCACAGLRPENELLTANNCLGRKLIRDASFIESALSNPRCDIAFDELILLTSTDRPNWSFRRTSQLFLSVQLWPRVLAYLNLPQHSKGDQLPLFSSSSKREQRPQLMDELRDIKRRLELLTNLVEESESPRRRNRRTER